MLLDGKSVHGMPSKEVAKLMGLLPQAPVAPEGITVADLVGRGRYPHQGWFRRWSDDDDRAVADALSATDTLELAGRPIEDMSGGQRQRVWIAMALARGFGGVPAAIDRYQRSSQVSLRAGIGAIRASAIFTGATTFSAGVLLAAVAGAAAAFAMQGRISIGELITVVGLASFISDPVRNIGGALREYASTRASAARVGELLGPSDRLLARPVEAEGDGLELLCVSAPGVTGLTLQVAPGELVGVVAASTVAADSLVGLLGGRVEPEIGLPDYAEAVLR